MKKVVMLNLYSKKDRKSDLELCFFPRLRGYLGVF